MAEISTETAIIGGGQAGVPLARALAQAGREAVLIEAEHLGGSCVNFGCTPSKAVIASARLANDARRSARLGLRIPNVEVDFLAVMERARGLAAQSRGELDRKLPELEKLRLIRAKGCFEGADAAGFRIRAGDMTVRAARVVLDTGTRTAMPPIAGLQDVPLLTSENWIDLRRRPAHLLILGGSYIALEMAQAFRRLGSQVTVVQKGPQLAEREDEDVAAALQEALEREDCRILLDAETQRVEAKAGGVRLYFADRSIVEGSDLLVATGRQPNTDGLGLETIGISPDDKGDIEVDEKLRTAREGVWAAGDIRGGFAFTHTAYDDFRVLRSQFLEDGARCRCRVVPYAIFMEPELGRVGMSEAAARKTGTAIKVARYDMIGSGKAREIGKTEGFIKIILDAAQDRLLGAAVLCEQGAELVQLLSELMNLGVVCADFERSVQIHPTLTEALKNAVLAARGAQPEQGMPAT